MPFTMCQLVMDRPDSVSLVTPPSMTAPLTRPQHPANHQPTARDTPALPASVAEDDKPHLRASSLDFLAPWRAHCTNISHSLLYTGINVAIFYCYL